MMKRILVSTPTQAKRLRAALDEDWQIDVYLGRVIDLPPHALGIDVAHDFRPTYGATQPRIVNRLRKALQVAEAIYVATTPTLDAEAHAWRLLRLAHVPATTSVMRVTLQALTEVGIRAAFAQPRPLDMQRVEAAETLRTVERLVGYLLTPLARQLLGADVSIGYLTSVALQHIAAQPPATPTRWGLRAQFETRAGERLQAELITREGRRVTLDTPDKAAQMTDLRRTAACWVAETAERTVARDAAPLSLAQLVTRAPFAPSQTLALATALYERGRITCPLVDDAIVPTDGDGALTGAAKVLFDLIAAQAAPKTETLRG
ncbi:MAG: hypothetical protein SF029_00095, partial [bacterium]|nr:hypothetical protein [bacterium]